VGVGSGSKAHVFLTSKLDRGGWSDTGFHPFISEGCFPGKH